MTNANEAAAADWLRKDMERIAEDVHISWMRQRAAEGWRWGERYSREEKTSPLMTDYALLPESEKEVDRSTVRQVAASLLRLGYQIERREEG